jgi:hypothetical protein
MSDVAAAGTMIDTFGNYQPRILVGCNKPAHG